MCQFCSIVFLLGLPMAAIADPAPETPSHRYRSLPELSNCSFYRPKKRDVPVYREADTASGVLARLDLGEEVCYVGEVGAFAILDWRKQPLISGRSAANGEVVAERAFARLVDLWPPRGKRGGSSGGLADWWMRYGGAMDDPLGGLRGEP